MAENDQIITGWMEWMRHNNGRSVSTCYKYQLNLNGLSEWLSSEGSGLLTATKDQVQQYCGRVLHEKGVLPRSRRPHIAAIRGFYKWAFQSGHINSDPSNQIPYPKTGRKLPHGMTLENAEKLLMQPDLGTFLGVRDSAILHLFIGCGIRLAGLIALNEQDLVFTNTGEAEQLLVRVTEKGDKERIVPGPPEAALMLRAYLGHPELDAVDRSLPSGKRVLFVSTRNYGVPDYEYVGEERRLSRRSVADLLSKYADQAGIPREQAHPHALRHLYGTELAESDVNILHMKTLMGHADANDTDIYVNVAVRKLAQVVNNANPLSKIKTPASGLARHLK